MTPELWVALAVATIGAVGGIVASIVSLLNKGKLESLEISINGRLTQLLAVNSQAAHAEGIVAGSMDANAITTALAQAMGVAIATTPPTTPERDTLTALDTNRRVKNIQDDAAEVAAALIVKNAAAIAAALVVKTAEEAAVLARHSPPVLKTAAEAVQTDKP